MPIRFHNADIRFSLKHKRSLQQFIHHQITKSSKLVPPYRDRLIKLDFIFCSDEYLLDINRRFLKHDYYTDIITFDLSDKNTKNERSLVSEIYISVERVRENSLKFEGNSSKYKVQSLKSKRSSPASKPETRNFQTELTRVMFHGVLHLLGYKDKTRKDKELMRKKENQWLKQFQLAVVS